MSTESGRPITTLNHNSNRKLQLIIGILATLLIPLLVAGALEVLSTFRRIEGMRVTGISTSQLAAENAKWIRDWSGVLRVPERDQKQDSNIEELKRRMEMLENQVQ